jgi:hypothetical protein
LKVPFAGPPFFPNPARHPTQPSNSPGQSRPAAYFNKPGKLEEKPLMTFINLLKKIGLIAGKAAPEVLSAIYPAIGALVQTVLQAIVLAEAKLGSGNGTAKKEEVLGAVQIAVPLILKVMENATGKDLVDDQLFSQGIDKLNDALVDILNSFRVLPKA